MLTNLNKSVRQAMIYGALSLFTISMVAFGQDPSEDPPPPPPQPSSQGWHKFSPPSTPAPPPQAPMTQSVPTPAAVPDHITIPAGTFVTVRVDQYLSSDKNQAGDGFSATLSRPLIVDGLIVARRGETLGGRVIDAKKAGRVKGVSHLQVGLTSLTLADGHQVAVQSELTSITGTTSNGRDAAAIVTTTATGAAIGAAAAWGPGAAIGGGAGLIAGTVGVLVTRGRPTIIYPEAQLTFRLARPVMFSTEQAPQAFVDARTLNTQRASAQGPPRVHRPPDIRADPIHRRTTMAPTTPITGVRPSGSITAADSTGMGTTDEASIGVNQVCPLLTCQQFFLRRTAGPPAKRD